jgi:hypothetical protein
MKIPLPESTKVLGSNQLLVPTFILIGFIGVFLGTLFDNPYTTTYPLSILLGTVGFIILKRAKTNSLPDFSILSIKFMLILYSLCFTSLIYFFIHSTMQRTPLIFALIFTLYLFVSILLVFGINVTYGLILTVMTGITQRALGFYSSSLYVGIDIYDHVSRTSGILAEGTLSGIGPTKYYYSPLYHLLTGWSSILLDVSLHSAIFLTVSVTISVIPVLIIYAILSTLVDSKIGLISALFYQGSDFVVGWGIHAIPTTMGVVLYTLTFFAALRYLGVVATGRYTSKRDFLLYFGFLTTVSLTHQLSLFVTITILGAVFLSKVLYESRITDRIINITLASGAVLYTNFVITRFGGPSGDRGFLHTIVEGLFLSILDASSNARIQSTLPDDPTISGVGADGLGIVHVAGSALLLALGILGVLLWLERSRGESRPVNGFLFGVAVGLPLVITLSGPIFGLRNLLPFRWFAFIYFPLCVLAGYGFVVGLRTASKVTDNYRMAAISVLIILLCLPYFALMGGNFTAAQDGPLFDDAPGAERLSTTESELAMYSHLGDYGSDDYTPLADVRAHPPLNHVGVNGAVPRIEYQNPDTIQSDVYLINRQYLRTKHAQYHLRYRGRTHSVYGPFPVDRITKNRQQIIYDTGEDDLRIID